jgi:PAS domain S-box-containing protein
MNTTSRFDLPTEDDLREFLNLSVDMLCIAGIDGYFKHLNPAWEQTLGYSKSELLSRPYVELVHPEDRESTIAELKKLATGRNTFTFECRYLCKDGSYKWLRWTGAARGEKGAVYASARDITPRKREEARLAAQHAVTRVLAEALTLASATPQILRAICESLSWDLGAIWRVDDKERLLRCVEAWHIPSMHPSEFDAVTRKMTFASGIGLPGQVWAHAEPVCIEDVTLDTNFPRAPIAVKEGLHGAIGFPVLLGSEVLGVLEFFSRQIQKPDRRLLEMMGAIGSQIGQFIERRQAEEALRVYARDLEAAKQRAEEATKTKSDFLANISHEIRTPMNAIIGMTELALHTRITREQREYLDAIKGSADALLTVINDLLDFSKIEAQKLRLDRVGFNLRDTLEDTIRVMAVPAHHKDLELACHIHPDVPDALVGDPLRLRQIVTNLVGNAIKFTDQGEVVLHVQLDSHLNGDVRLHFSVADTGIGIPAAKQKMIFQAFSQADSSTTRRYGGTGLGLAISTQLVELMGGRIWVESQSGQGSTFHFTAAFQIRNSDALQPSARGSKLTDLTVLIVDDNETNRLILREVLTSWHMHPVAVDGSAAGLAALEKSVAENQPFEVVLLDAHMPLLDGFGFAKRIKQEPRYTGIKLIMLTSAGQPEDVSRCQALGISAYLTKPVKQSELFDVIVSVLSPQDQKLLSVSPKRRVPPFTQRRLQVLLAEDNSVNQMLATRILEKMGHHVTVVGNGREAVSASQAGRFDLIVMDVQMPEMDGFEATAAIRKWQETSNERIPIIAMTAHVMKGDRERCLAAGMDAYVSKPIRIGDLEGAIGQVMVPSRTPSTSTGTVRKVSEVVDEAVLLAGLDGDYHLLRKLARLFMADCPKQLAEIKAAIELGDAERLWRAAHTLKGSVGNFAAERACEAAQRLEILGRDGNINAAQDACLALEDELSFLTEELRKLSRASPATAAKARKRSRGKGLA